MRILIDTNLLVLLFVGSASEDDIAVHRRTRSYTVDDFLLLKLLMADAESFVTTPNVLAETSNLIRQSDEPRVARILEVFEDFVAMTAESYIRSAEAIESVDFRRLGLNDVTVLAAQGEDVTLLTDDLGLYLASAQAGKKVVNFSHERARVLG